MDAIHQFGFMLLMVVGVSAAIKILRQPIIIGYVISGLIFARFFTGDASLSSLMALLSEVGIMFLLFLMGIEFDLKSLKNIGKDVFITAVYQSVILFALGFGIAWFFPFSLMEKVYLAIMMMFSSTLLVAKWVENKKETATLHGRIIISTLIIQDIIAILAITILDVIDAKSISSLVLIPASSILLLLTAFFSARYVLNIIFKKASRYTELLFILSLAICFFFGEMASFLGYSMTIGAFIGGVVLGNTIYKTDIYGRLKPLIIFFNMLFFVSLGFQINTDFSLSLLLFVALFIMITLLLKPVIVYLTLRFRGYDQKTSFLSGIYLAQVSEFGIIMVIAGIEGSIIGKSLLSLSILLTIVTMILSVYFIKYDKRIFQFLSPKISYFERFFITKEKMVKEDKNIDAQVILFGYYEFGQEFMQKLKDINKKIIVIENDPSNIEMLKKEGVSYLFNTVYSPEFFEHVKFINPELVISNKMDLLENKMIVKELKKLYPKLNIIVTAKRVSDALELYNAQADYVIYPSYVNEQHVSVLLQDYTTDINKLITKKVLDIERFKKKADDERSVNKGIVQDIDSFFKSLQSKYKQKEKR